MTKLNFPTDPRPPGAGQRKWEVMRETVRIQKDSGIPNDFVLAYCGTKEAAHLVAAAPDMLAALQSLIGEDDEGAKFSDRIAKAKAAISKATGAA